jgi:2-oxoisovalerate dehydrogenase E1 component beta subunit
MHARSGGSVPLPVVIRIPYGGGIGAVEHHSESPEAYFAHTAGLKVLTCSTPADAYSLVQQAIASPDPVIFFEPKRRYWEKGEVDLDRPLDQALSPWRAQVVRAGTDVTLLAYGPMVKTCLEAAEAAECSIEVVDLRSLSPLDLPTITEAVRRTRRCVVVHEAPRTVGLGAELAAHLAEVLYYEMEAPVLRVTGYDIPYPPSRLEEDFLPDLDRVLEAVDRSLGY